MNARSFPRLIILIVIILPLLALALTSRETPAAAQPAILPVRAPRPAAVAAEGAVKPEVTPAPPQAPAAAPLIPPRRAPAPGPAPETDAVHPAGSAARLLFAGGLFLLGLGGLLVFLWRWLQEGSAPPAPSVPRPVRHGWPALLVADRAQAIVKAREAGLGKG